MPTGWRPDDVKDKYPLEVIENVYQQKKYDPVTSKLLQYWSWAQLVIGNLLLYHLLVSIADLGFVNIALYSGFLFLMIFAYTTLMDGHQFALVAEVLKALLGFGIILQSGGWFGLDASIPGGSMMIGMYLLFSVGMTVYFLFWEKREPEKTFTTSV